MINITPGKSFFIGNSPKNIHPNKKALSKPKQLNGAKTEEGAFRNAYINKTTPKPPKKDMLRMIKISVKLCIGENVVVPTARINAPKADAKAEYKNKTALDTFLSKLRRVTVDAA